MGKKMTAAQEKIEPRFYGLKEAVEAVKQAAFAKYDESVDLAIRLGIDPKRSDQMVRGTTTLPTGTCTIPAFSTLNSTRPLRISLTALPTSNVTVPVFLDSASNHAVPAPFRVCRRTP